MDSGLTNSQQVVAGFQDNATQQPPTPGVNAAWSAVASGDGGGVLPSQPYQSGDSSFPAYAPGDSSYAYHVFAFPPPPASACAYYPLGSCVSVSTDGGATWYQNTQSLNLQTAITGAGDIPGFFPPLVVDPTNPKEVTYGAHHVFVTTDAMSTWPQVGPDLSNAPGCTDPTACPCHWDEPSCALEDLEFAPGLASSGS